MKKYGFLRHHRKIKIEGTDLPKIVNKCIDNEIILKDLKYCDQIEATVGIKGEDLDRLRKLAGHSYRMTCFDESGLVPLTKTIKHNIISIMGAFLLGALIFYQSLFVAEIRVDGYATLTETEIRQTLKEAGLYEGCRKPETYNDIKTDLYENHDAITWVSIYEDGRLIKVSIAEAGKAEAADPEDKTPIDIVAARSGMIEKILPLQGNAAVQKGDYVNEGDLLISGAYEYQSTDYSRGDEIFTMYSHAKGQALARIPRQVCFYMQKAQHAEKLTGKLMPGIYIRIGDIEVDTAGPFYRYKYSVRNEKPLIKFVKAVPFEAGFVTVAEAENRKKYISKTEKQRITEAAIRQYERDRLKEGEEILSYEIEYSETENLIKAAVFMEVLEDIGKEKEIKVKKEEKEEEKLQ